ncbi:MAG: Gfo/Idh/MocA family oxidoreductase, partial [Gemmatimonadaceae bacterium]
MTEPSDRVGVGVVGCGVIAYWVYLRLLSKMRDARLIVASDPSPAARARAEQVVKCPIVESADSVLEHPVVDAVVICAPTEFHADLTIAALASGKHVFVEKPIAIDAESSERVMTAVGRTDCIARVGFNRRRHPMFEQAKMLLADGAIGEVRAIQSAFCEPMVANEMSEWRRTRKRGGGVLLDLASHHFDLMR